MTTYRVWHGTCKQWTRFDLRACYPQSCCGRGYYFSDCINDAESYSKSTHPDHRSKMWELADRLEQQRKIRGNTAVTMAQRVYSAQPRVIECELTIKKPLEFWKEHSRVYIERKSFKRLEKALAGYREDSYSLDSDNHLLTALLEGVDTSKLFKLMQRCGLSVFPNLVRALGYDGCIMHNTSEWFPGLNSNLNSNHYIVYNRGQINKVAEHIKSFE